jgi:hypothetical protein
MNIRGPLGPKAPKPVRGTDAAKAHLARVKSLPCVICGAPPPSDAHLVISGRFGSIKASDFNTIPLCKAHHQHGPEAIHQDKAGWEAKHGLDADYLPIVKAAPHPLIAAAQRRHNRENAK